MSWSRTRTVCTPFTSFTTSVTVVRRRWWSSLWPRKSVPSLSAWLPGTSGNQVLALPVGAPKSFGLNLPGLALTRCLAVVVAVDVSVGEGAEVVVSWAAATVDCDVDDGWLSQPATAAARQSAAATETTVRRGRGCPAMRATLARRSLNLAEYALLIAQELRGGQAVDQRGSGERGDPGCRDDDRRAQHEQRAEHVDEEVRHAATDEQPGNAAEDRHPARLHDQEGADLASAHALGAQRHVLPPPLQEQPEHEHRDRGRRHGQRVGGVERQQAVDVQGRQARLVLVERGLPRVDLQRVDRPGAVAQGRDRPRQRGGTGVGHARQEEARVGRGDEAHLPL